MESNTILVTIIIQIGMLHQFAVRYLTSVTDRNFQYEMERLYMKKKVAIISSIVLVVIVVAVILIMQDSVKESNNKKELKQGTYYTYDKESIIEIKEDGTFEFLRHIAMNWSFKGNYTIDNDKLILSDPSAGEYEFKIVDNNTLIFEKGNEYTDKLISIGTEYFLEMAED